MAGVVGGDGKRCMSFFVGIWSDVSAPKNGRCEGFAVGGDRNRRGCRGGPGSAPPPGEHANGERKVRPKKSQSV